MNMLNFAVVVPMPIHHYDDGGNIIWGKVLIIAIVSFVLIVLPFLIYITNEYIKHKKEYPTWSFDWNDYPVSIIIIGGYITLFVCFFILWITEVVYELIF